MTENAQMPSAEAMKYMHENKLKLIIKMSQENEIKAEIYMEKMEDKQ